MDCTTQLRPGTTLIDVWLWDDSGSRRRLHRLVGPDEWRTEEIEPLTRADHAPTLTLPLDWARALVREMGDVMPPDATQARHLDDVIRVRDRLLDLVVAQIGGARPPEA